MKYIHRPYEFGKMKHSTKSYKVNENKHKNNNIHGMYTAIDKAKICKRNNYPA